MTQPPTSRIPAWLPLGLASFGVLGILRWLSLLAIDENSLGGDPANSAWNVANGLPEALLHVAVFAMVGSALLAMSEGRRLLTIPAAASFACAATGWPLAPASFLPQLAIGTGLERVLPLVIASVVWSVALYGVARATRGSSLATVLLVASGVGLTALPFWFGLISVETPNIAVRHKVRQLIDDENFDKLRFLSWSPAIEIEERQTRDERNPEKAPSDWTFPPGDFEKHAKKHYRKVISPAVYKEYDVGDKYTLIAFRERSSSSM